MFEHKSLTLLVTRAGDENIMKYCEKFIIQSTYALEIMKKMDSIHAFKYIIKFNTFQFFICCTKISINSFSDKHTRIVSGLHLL